MNISRGKHTGTKPIGITIEFPLEVPIQECIQERVDTNTAHGQQFERIISQSINDNTQIV